MTKTSVPLVLCTLVAWGVPFSWCCPACPCAPGGGFASKSDVFPAFSGNAAVFSVSPPPPSPTFLPWKHTQVKLKLTLRLTSTPMSCWNLKKKNEKNKKQNKKHAEKVLARRREDDACVLPASCGCFGGLCWVLCVSSVVGRFLFLFHARSQPRPRASTQHRSHLLRRSALFYWMQ